MADATARRVKFAVSEDYKASWKRYYNQNPDIITTLTEFNNAKRVIPPKRLSDKMRDHVLGGQLHGIRECHLAGDVLLLYTHGDDIVKLLLVCEHNDLKGKKGKELAKHLARLK
jgi:addiction module RelE/StbE family toxin